MSGWMTRMAVLGRAGVAAVAMLVAISPAVAQIDEATAQALYHKTDLFRTSRDSSDFVLEPLSPRYSKPLTPDESQRLRVRVMPAASHVAIRNSVVQTLRESVLPKDAKAVLVWFDTPMGRAMAKDVMRLNGGNLPMPATPGEAWDRQVGLFAALMREGDDEIGRQVAEHQAREWATRIVRPNDTYAKTPLQLLDEYMRDSKEAEAMAESLAKLTMMSQLARAGFRTESELDAAITFWRSETGKRYRQARHAAVLKAAQVMRSRLEREASASR